METHNNYVQRIYSTSEVCKKTAYICQIAMYVLHRQLKGTDFRLALLECVWPAECPWAWLSRAWRGWRTDSCPRINRRGRPRTLPGGPWRRTTGNGGLSWNLALSRERVAGREACGWGAQWTSGSGGSLSGPPFRDDNGGASSRRPWRARTSSRLWWRAVCGAPFLRSTCGRSASYGPWWATIL